MTTYLARNLCALCARERSVSSVCRSLAINRQQFSRYLSGESRPSAHNLYRICQHFGVDESDLQRPPEEFRELLGGEPPRQAPGHPGDGMERRLRRAFAGDRRVLMRLCGYHHIYFRSPTWPGRLARGLVALQARDGLFVSKTVMRNADRRDGQRYLSKYEGLATSLHDRVFVIEAQILSRDAIVETVLYPSARSHATLVSGVTFGVTHRSAKPYLSPTVWKALGPAANLRAALGATGLIDPQRDSLDRRVLSMLDEAAAEIGAP